MIIAICGLSPQVGKTTTAKYLQEKLGGGLLAEFSEPIELYAYEYTDYNGNKSDPVQRKILQDIGLCFKQKDPSYWIYRAIYCSLKRNQEWEGREDTPTIRDMSHAEISKFKKWAIKEGVVQGFCIATNAFFENDDVPIFISGTRSSAEADEIKRLGGRVILIKRYINDSDRNWEKHKVENQLARYDGFDTIIENDGTIEDLYSKIDEQVLNGVLILCMKSVNI